MTVKELEGVIKDLRDSGFSDEQIVYSFINLYVQDKISLDACDSMLNVLGFHICEDILNASPEEQKNLAIKLLNDR